MFFKNSVNLDGTRRTESGKVKGESGERKAENGKHYFCFSVLLSKNNNIRDFSSWGAFANS